MSLTDQQAEQLEDLEQGLKSGTLVLTGYMRLAYLTAVKSGWHDGPTPASPLPEFIAHLHGEVSEAWEAWREKGDERKKWYKIPYGIEGVTDHHQKPEGVWIEIIDVLIRIFHRAEFMGVDIEALLDEKMAYNLTRPYRHGGKHT